MAAEGRAAITTEVNTELPTNNSRKITALKHRGVLDTYNESKFNLVDDYLDIIKGRPTIWNEVGDAGQPAFQNGWTNSLTRVSPLSFKLINDMQVHIRGVITKDTSDGVIFTLPAAYRPLVDTYLVGNKFVPGIGSIAIQTNGDVSVGDILNGGSASLDGVSFWVD